MLDPHRILSQALDSAYGKFSQHPGAYNYSRLIALLLVYQDAESNGYAVALRSVAPGEHDDPSRVEAPQGHRTVAYYDGVLYWTLAE